MNIPFELIFIVLFFVLPAISSVVRRVQGRGQPRPPTRTRPTRTDTSGPEARAETSADTRTDVPRWLEEAQRRVREAQQSETDGQGRRGTQASSTPQSQTVRPRVQPRPSATRPNQARPATTRPKPTSYEDYRPEAVSLERTSAPTRRPATTPAPPMRVQRVGGRRGTKLVSYKMRFDEQTLMTGFIWHQILSEPLSKSRRNRQSQRRS